jgi:hypothetical protein
MYMLILDWRMLYHINEQKFTAQKSSRWRDQTVSSRNSRIAYLC